ncbi:MAG TPA: glycosyltransferase family 2 protein [Thermoanaerobaculia bacterium]|jgi:glycosyltransferase involved in cell wall biosynthesis|nr:glycosyltransferase family 2 protein [Thermoanaerobaculia bacterium]
MQSREGIYIVVPAYNEASAVHDVVRDLRSEYAHVVVVDDGSDDATAAEARRAGAIVIQHIVNRGQGAALQTGIDYSVQRGAEIVVTFDADGQHRVEDVDRLIDALKNRDADIAVGSRFLDLRSNVPALRKLTLRIAARFMLIATGVALTDAHNGLRALRRQAAAQIHLTIDGMAHASEIVDQIRRLRLRVTEVPVVIHYSEYSMRKGQSSLAAFRIAFDYLMKRIFR